MAITSRIPTAMQQTDEATRHTTTILVIENNPVLAQMLTYCFTLALYNCSVMDIIDMMTILASREMQVCASPDGIILDVDSFTDRTHLFNVLQAISPWWQHAFALPCVVLTTDLLLGAKLQQEGYTVVIKPFKPTMLLHTMITAIEGNHPTSIKSDECKTWRDHAEC